VPVLEIIETVSVNRICSKETKEKVCLCIVLEMFVDVSKLELGVVFFSLFC